jgi:hypothetical protein
VKVGDLIKYNHMGFSSASGSNDSLKVGTVLEFPPASHPKEFQKVKVMTENGLMENWIMQFCKVINESR